MYFRGKYNFLSNFYRCGIEFKGNYFTSVENAYQSEKSDSLVWKEFCKQETSSAVKLRSKRIIIRKDWDDVKLSIMKELIDIKFDIPLLKEMLINTGDILLEEHNYWGDEFFGICDKTMKGENNLGKIIMEKRSRCFNK